MIEKKEDNIRSESFYPDSKYRVDQNNTPEETPLSEDQISNRTKFCLLYTSPSPRDRG